LSALLAFIALVGLTMAVNIVLLNVATSGLRDISSEEDEELEQQQQQQRLHRFNSERATVDEALKQLVVRTIVIEAKV